MADTTPTPETAKTARKSRAADPAVAMPDGAEAAATATAVAASGTSEARAKFSQAIEEAKAGAQALGKQAQDTAEAYRGKLSEKTDAVLGDAKAMSEQAMEKAAALAREGKARTVDGISTVSRLVADNSGIIDEKLGAKYGDYARAAAKSLDDTAARLDAKDLGELGEDAREMVRKSPALAVGIAAAAGFFLARLFKGSAKSED